MALPGITFNRGTSGLGRPLPGSDYISGMLFYIDDANLPSGFATDDRVKKIFSLADAEDLGILDTHIDEVKAEGTVTFTAVGANGDTVNITVTEYGEDVDLGTFTKTASESTVTLLAVAVKAVINAGTDTHGYTSDNVAGALTITAREGLGVFLNSGTPLSTTIVGTMTATVAQFGAGSLADGVASPIDPIHYHIKEFFRIQPKGVLYVGIYDIPGTFDFTEAKTIIDFADGEIKQLGVYVTDDTLDAALVTVLDGILMTSESEDKPASAILCADFNGTALSALPTLAGNSDYRVSVVIGQDGANKGYELYKAKGKTIGTLGATLGAVSRAAVNENIGWVATFDMSDGNELETLAFGNGATFKTQTTSLLNTLNNYKYISLRKFIDKAGSFHNDSHTAIANTNDFAYVENVRTVDKAVRGIRVNTLDKLNSPLLLNEDGTLFEDDIADFIRVASITLDQMARDQEISAYNVDVDPDQDVLTTSKVVITVSIVPTGTAREIEFNIGLTTSVS
jgi:hypothetical protein